MCYLLFAACSGLVGVLGRASLRHCLPWIMVTTNTIMVIIFASVSVYHAHHPEVA